MAVLNVVAFLGKWNARFADNVTGEISEGDMREFSLDLTDSFTNIPDATAPSAAYSSITGNASDSSSLVTYVSSRITDLKGGVSAPGDTLLKLYNLITAAVDGGTAGTPLASIKLRRDTAANWTSSNPVLATGELGLETDTLLFKIGNGATAWASLSYRNHLQNTDTSTNSNDFSIGDGTNTGHKSITANKSGSPKPKIRYNTSSSKWEFSNDGTTFVEHGSNAVWGSITGTITGQSDLVTYIDDEISGAVVGLFDDRGNYDASPNTFPASGGSGTAGAILKGDIWTISVAGTLGGTAVEAGQTVRAKQDTPGQTAGNWAISVGSTEIPNASTTVAGKVEKATPGEASAGTSTGATGAELFLGPAEAKTLFDSKVDKVTGKGLSTEDYTTAEKSKVTNLPLNTNTELGLKFDKVGGTITGAVTVEAQVTIDDGSGPNVSLLPEGVIVEDIAGKQVRIEGDNIEYDQGTYSITVVAETATANRTITIPNQTGKLATHKHPAIQIFMHQNCI